jgi:conjugal transfer pilus assembly protein TraV
MKLMAVKAVSLWVPIVLAGCSFTQGKSEFSCPGGVDGVHCMSAREVYKATAANDYVRPQNSDDADAKDSGEKPRIPVKSSAVPVPTIEQPIPIRTQAQVMRIWVSPWEDDDGDLHADGYIYTEIEGRKWNLGDRFKAPNPVISPLTTTTK